MWVEEIRNTVKIKCLKNLTLQILLLWSASENSVQVLSRELKDFLYLISTKEDFEWWSQWNRNR